MGHAPRGRPTVFGARCIIKARAYGGQQAPAAIAELLDVGRVVTLAPLSPPQLRLNRPWEQKLASQATYFESLTADNRDYINSDVIDSKARYSRVLGS
jgi:hypothetical protein